VAAIIKRFDIDGDGSLEFTEFCLWANSTAALALNVPSGSPTGSREGTEPISDKLGSRPARMASMPSPAQRQAPTDQQMEEGSWPDTGEVEGSSRVEKARTIRSSMGAGSDSLY